MLRADAWALVAARQQPFLDRLDLQREIFRVDPALREAAGDEPQAGLRRCACTCCAAPGRRRSPRSGRRASATSSPNSLRTSSSCALVAGRQHDQVGGERLAVLHPRAVGDEPSMSANCRSPISPLDDQVGAADVEIIAAAAGEIFELPAGVVLAEVELEADALPARRATSCRACFDCSVSSWWLLRASASGIEVAIRSLSSAACLRCRAHRPAAPTARY